MERNAFPRGQRLLQALARRRGELAGCALGAVLVTGFALQALAVDPASRTAPVTRPTPAARVRHWLQVGEASWYGLKLQGHRTATGERLDVHALTCAHPSLPLGSWLRVTNLRNRKSIFVRVNDRGPFGAGRIVDLSYAAAQAVGLTGTGKVKLETVTPSDPAIAQALLAQVGVPVEVGERGTFGAPSLH